jgi:hypothetical protein
MAASTLSQQVSACAFGRSAALVAHSAAGRSSGEIDAALINLSDWLEGNSDDRAIGPRSRPTPARSRKSRRGAILLPFRALLAAIGSAK